MMMMFWLFSEVVVLVGVGGWWSLVVGRWLVMLFVVGGVEVRRCVFF